MPITTLKQAWNIIDGVTTCRDIEERLRPIGYHCALGGSVLHSGFSEKDLDVFIYPHDADKRLPAETVLMAVLDIIPATHGKCNSAYEPRDSKAVYWSYTPRNQRIDFFFLMPHPDDVAPEQNQSHDMKDYEIDISKLDRAEVLAALWNHSDDGYLHKIGTMTRDEAQAEIDKVLEGEQGKRLYFDYLKNRVLKIDLGKDLLDTRLYDRDNGQGAAGWALAHLQQANMATGADNPKVEP